MRTGEIVELFLIFEVGRRILCIFISLIYNHFLSFKIFLVLSAINDLKFSELFLFR